MSCNAKIEKSLSFSLLDSQKSVIVFDRARDLICKNILVPLLLKPYNMPPSPVETESSVSRGEWDALDWLLDMKNNFLKSVKDSSSEKSHSSSSRKVIIELTCHVEAVVDAEIYQKAIIS